jgi:hypothetical protein
MPDPRTDTLNGRLRTAQVPPRATASDCAPLPVHDDGLLQALNQATAPRPGQYADGGVLARADDPLIAAYGSRPWREPTYPHRDPHQPAYDEDAYRD